VAQTPKRSAELSRSQFNRRQVSSAASIQGVRYAPVIPEPNPEWHYIAATIYASLRESGQSDFYQSSDWALAYSLCDDLSRFKREEEAHDVAVARWMKWHEIDPEDRKEQGFHPDFAPKIPKGGSAIKLETVMSGLSRLAVTEVDRLKVRMELQEPSDPEASAEVIAIEDAKKRLGA